MVIEHTLKNVGIRSIQGSTYNHNFLVLQNEPPGPAFTIDLPFKPVIDQEKKPWLGSGAIRRHYFPQNPEWKRSSFYRS